MPVKPVRPFLITRRSIIAAASGLAFAGGWSNSASAQFDESDLPDAVDAMNKVMPTPAPPLVFTDAKGKRLTLADYAGHTLVVNLWATWCPPCIMELPGLAALALKIKPSGGLVLPISIDLNGASAVQPFYAKNDIHGLPVLLDPDGKNLQILHTDGIPVTIIINAAGQMVARLDGAAYWNSKRMVAFLQSLGGPPPAKAKHGAVPL
ncbi:MAG TPA: TlpA disulfide reductase family protein [Acidocella sp.]|nr:TlpA disulfide reductase family protein [Acidocella sp.]